MASLLVDLENTTQQWASIALADGVGNVPASGVIVGNIIDMKDADTNCNMQVNAGPCSGPFFVKVQNSDAVTSGSFTDPTSGYAVMPSQFLSGGRLCVNSGLVASGGPQGTFIDSAPLMCSGGVYAGSFQRVGRFTRAIIESGSTIAQHVSVNFISQLIATGSGGGYSISPQSGGTGINV